MARPATKDPLDKFRWTVTIEPQGGGPETFIRLGFTSVEVPEMSINTQSYPEGGNHVFPKKIIESVEYRPVTLMRGVTQNVDFHNWAIEFIELLAGNQLFPAESSGNGNIPGEYRRDVRIEHRDRAGRVVKTYVLHNAFPTEYKPASDFSADADDMLSMEKLTLTYESFSIVLPEGSVDSNPFSVKDVAKRLLRRAF